MNGMLAYFLACQLKQSKLGPADNLALRPIQAYERFKPLQDLF